MNVPGRIKKMEKEVKAKGYSIGDLCDTAGVNRTTWQRWRNGEISPNLKRWERAELAYRTLVENAA